MDNWITTTEASKISGFHVEYIRRLIRGGHINARKWGKEWMVDKQSLIDYQKQDNKPGPKPSSKK